MGGPVWSGVIAVAVMVGVALFAIAAAGMACLEFEGDEDADDQRTTGPDCNGD